MNDPLSTLDEHWTRFKKSRDLQSRDAIVENYMPFVRLLAERLWAELPHCVELDDLISSGTYGLLCAIDSFDQSVGVKFETFATPRVRGAMLDELRMLDWAPRVLRLKANRVENATQELQARLGRQPREHELAEHLELDLRQLDSIRQSSANANAVSLTSDRSVGSDGEQVRRVDILEDPRTPDPFWTLHRKEIRAIVLDTVESLPRQERLVVVLYYFEQLTMKQIGNVLGLSESRVCQVHAGIILRLQRQMLRWKEELLALQH